MNVLAPLLIGAAFGILLQRAKLGRYETIVNVFRFTDLTVVKFLLSALVVSMLGVQALLALGVVDRVPVPQTYVMGNLLGGVAFGAGMALAGFCPGTVAAGAGEGRLDYLVLGMLGMYAGAVVYGLTYARVFPRIAAIADAGAVTLDRVLGVDAWLVVLVFAEIALLVLLLIERPHVLRRLASFARREHRHA